MVRATGRRLEAARLCQQGLSNDEIAKKLGIGVVTVVKYLNRYLQTDSRFPAGIDVGKAELMRSEQREHLEGFQRRLLNRAEKLASIAAYDPSEACALASATAKLCDSYTRVSERISALYGLDSPRPQPATQVTNNNVLVANDAMIARVMAITAERKARASGVPVEALIEPGVCPASGG
jgi:predicted transcriptional regulator